MNLTEVRTMDKFFVHTNAPKGIGRFEREAYPWRRHRSIIGITILYREVANLATVLSLPTQPANLYGPMLGKNNLHFDLK